MQYELPARYDPKEIEPKWQEYWKRPEVYAEVYRFRKEDKTSPVYVIDTPPPFTSGELHMGHAYWNILNDTIARYKRMRGYNVLLPQGWDCQGLPTELKVQYKWGIPKDNRELFREKCREWTELMIQAMKESMTKLGYRPDWEQFEYRTMDLEYWRYVQLTLIMMHEKKLIYRAEFPVHWCPKCETALAQAELGYVEEKAELYYILFPCEEGELVVATTRPELLPACQALAVHPGDDRYKGFVGKQARVPLFDKKIPILADDAVDPEFGTGVVMICTFGDEQDIRWQQKYGLKIAKVVDERGRMINAGKYSGMPITDARKAIVEDLEEEGYLKKREEFVHKVLSHTDRPDCLSPIEFLVRKQWFIKVKPFLNEVVEACSKMLWTPSHMFQRLVDWANSIEWDWVISRQRVHGTPIPFWYCEDCDEIIAPPKDKLPVNPAVDPPPVEKCPKCGSTRIKGAEDVCDCWIDSSITPLVITGFFDDPELFERTYPATVRQQGHDIIRTWLFYTTLRCLQITGKPPFKEVLVNGHILGPDGYKMSKSRGNVVMPEDGLETYGADSLRQFLLSITIGSDLPFKWEGVKYGKSFLQKLWSAARLASPFLKDYDYSETDVIHLTPIDNWILRELRKTILDVEKTMDEYQMHLALSAIQEFFWLKFCDQYLEAVKYRIYGERKSPSWRAACFTLYTVLWNSIVLLAPFCPHITEELYHRMFKERVGLISIHAARWPRVSDIYCDERLAQEGEVVVEALAKIRSEKSKRRIALSAKVKKVVVAAPSEAREALAKNIEDLKNVLHIEEVELVDGPSIQVLEVERG